ncbi:MAG: hypothetical protein JWO72_3244 [Caulobacteraceae bacterium]|nr:hypothetical protein [Caulobacteraceae bacterium]
MFLTYGKLASLSSGLGVDITFFFASQRSAPRQKRGRPEERPSHREETPRMGERGHGR